MFENFLGSFAFAHASHALTPERSRLRYSASFSKKSPSLPIFSKRLCRLAREPQAVGALVATLLCRRWRSSENFDLAIFCPKTGYARPKGPAEPDLRENGPKSKFSL